MVKTQPKRVESRDITKDVLMNGLAHNPQQFHTYHQEEKREITKATRTELEEVAISGRKRLDTGMALIEVERVANQYTEKAKTMKEKAITEVRI